jgi:hypothetical protein
MDFVNDDIENMVREYDQWKREYDFNSRKMEEQKSVTEESLTG